MALDIAQEDRKTWLSLLAKAPDDALADLCKSRIDGSDHVVLRQPEIGGVMVRGRAGAVGSAFNLGEMTVTRTSIKLPDGTVGHGYVQGRNKDKALRAALIDALMQTGAASQIRADILIPLEHHIQSRAKTRAAKAAATKVDFFTIARGED